MSPFVVVAVTNPPAGVCHAPFTWSTAVLGVLGAVCVLTALTQIIPAMLDALGGDTFAIPGRHTYEFEEGTYVVFERTGSRTQVANFTYTEGGPVRVSPYGVRVEAADGSTLEVGSNQTIERGGDIYLGAVEFEVHRPGTYEVVVEAPEGGKVLVTRDLGDRFGSLVPWFVLGATGMLLAGIATWVAIVRAMRRSRQLRNLPPPPAQAFSSF